MNRPPKRGTEGAPSPKTERTILPGLLTAMAVMILTCALAFSFTAKRVEGVRKHTRGSDE